MTILRQSTVATSDTLLPYLIGPLGLKRAAAKSLLKFGAVTINGATVRQFDHLLAIGDVVVVQKARTAAAQGRLDYAKIQIVFEDESLIVLEKPAGLLTVGNANDKTDTLFARLNDFLQQRDSTRPERALVVHRLDRETSGLALFAKNEECRRLLQQNWASVEKDYLAIVQGAPEPEQGTITGYLTETSALDVFNNDHQTPGGRLAITHYRLLQSRGDYSLLEVRLQTGRKHQIRVHLAGLGCLVVGDRRYGSKVDPCDRLGLHACRLAFAHPLSGAPLSFDSPLPPALRKLFPPRRPPGKQPLR
jgi:23S rRNA pseudouridine1911/1915/1917 synthase